MKISLPILALLFCVQLGCAPDPKSGDGFTLPEGDPDQGRLTFTQLKCQACHTIRGIEFEESELSDSETPNQKMIALGGEKPYVTTYGDLVTSIINPSHRFAAGYTDEEIKSDGVSKMRLYNDEMTITQLSDLVTFLESHYEVRAYHPTPYMPYY